MSRAFVKEDAGERWTPPQPVRAYRVLLEGDVLHETDDLLAALHWLQTRPTTGFELRGADGQLLATN